MTPEVVELLLRTKAAVLANPDHFDMDFWYASGDDFYARDEDESVIEIDALDVVPDTPLLGMLDRCGTVACAAGWIVALSGEKVNPGEFIAHAGARLLGFEDYMLDPCPLFHTSRWPSPLENAYNDATSVEDQAKALADAIDLWIELDGDAEAFSSV